MALGTDLIPEGGRGAHMGMMIAAIAVGPLLITSFAIGVERRKEWTMRQRRIEARHAGLVAGDANPNSTADAPMPKSQAPREPNSSAGNSGWRRRQTRHGLRIVRRASTTTTAS